jgi:hypothetical protein
MNYGALNTGTLNGTSSTDEDATLLDGVISDYVFKADGIFSNILVGGVDASWTLKANCAFSDVLSDGVISSWTLKANNILSDVLSGGLARTFGIGSKYIISCVVNGGISQSETLYAGLSRTLVGGVAYDWALPHNDLLGYYGALNTCIVNYGTLNGTSNTGEDITLLIGCVVNGGISQSETLSAGLSLTFVGGITSTWRLTDTDISSYYGDMLHNTWQLAIESATLILEINTPIGDS